MRAVKARMLHDKIIGRRHIEQPKALAHPHIQQRRTLDSAEHMAYRIS
jgi:hypothetical protein